LKENGKYPEASEDKEMSVAFLSDIWEITQMNAATGAQYFAECRFSCACRADNFHKARSRLYLPGFLFDVD
jgi:hypothetical protein